MHLRNRTGRLLPRGSLRQKLLGGSRTALSVFLAYTMAVPPVTAQNGITVRTPNVPLELPVEVEIELAPAASLKKAPLWKELIQLLKFPYAQNCAPNPNRPGMCETTAQIQRRPSFTATPMPPLNVWPLNYNFLTAQPMRLRTSDGEVSWDQPGPLFDPDQECGPGLPCDQFNTPLALRRVIGALVACPLATPVNQNPYRFGGPCDFAPAGSLVVSNPSGQGVRRQLGYSGNNADPRIPPHRTVVAVSAFLPFSPTPSVAGQLQELDGVSTTATVPVETPLEIPVNEEDFFRDPAVDGPAPGVLAAYTGRRAAEVLGKALFWDMQVGSDGIQACGSCHFHGGVDNRAHNQRNPNTTGPLGNSATLEALAGSNTTVFNSDVVAADFPFHKTVDPNASGQPGNQARDSNDVMSSMGVSRFKQFDDIPLIGTFIGGGALPPDLGTAVPDLVPVNEGFRRVEPRNTPTMHAAAFNFDNFWDGRARFAYNGGSVFGASDPQFHIWVNNGTAGGAMHGLPNPEEKVDALGNPLPLDQWAPEPGEEPVPARIKFSSLASQSQGPPLSDFEMSFAGRNWAKIGKKLLQAGVKPLANQLVSTTDSVLGPLSNGATTPGLSVSYPDLVRAAFSPRLWANTSQRFNGAPCASDPFDGFCLGQPVSGAASATDRLQFNQMEANFSLFFGLAVQAYEELLIPDDTPFDRFMDANPLAANAVGQPGEQAVLFPTLIRGLVGGGVTQVPGFGPDEIVGFDIFAGANLSAALPAGSLRNPRGLGSNPFTRNARCMLCHLGPEQTDHSINISHGLLKGDAEFEFPTPPSVPGTYAAPGGNTAGVAIAPFTLTPLPAPEPPGPAAVVGGLILAEEIEGRAQDVVEVEPRGFAINQRDNPATPWDDRAVGQPAFFAFGDQGIYNVGVRPCTLVSPSPGADCEDVGRGANDPFGWPLSVSALALMDIAQPGFVPCDGTVTSCPMTNYDANNPESRFEETGEGLPFPGSSHTLQSINPGFEKDPATHTLPEYLAPWVTGLPAGELHPEIDEMAFGPNVITPPIGGPALEFGEALFGADTHCGQYNPALFGSPTMPPNFGWGPFLARPTDTNFCPNNNSGVPGNFDGPLHGTWPVPNRVLKNGAFKAPPLRNVELTGPYFHTGSYLTLRQVVDFYLRGGDFPISNAESRDPHIVDVSEQSFGFGRTACGDPAAGITCAADGLYQPLDLNTLVPGAFTPAGTWVVPNGFADAFPDTAYLYDRMPDTNNPLTPEPSYMTLDNVKTFLVKFLLSLTDDRVKYERPPFDKPEMFVPIDGIAPENTLGRGAEIAPAPGTLNALSSCSVAAPCTVNRTTCTTAGCTTTPVTVTTPLFRKIPATGAAGLATPLPNFLNISSCRNAAGVVDTASCPAGLNNDHFDP